MWFKRDGGAKADRPENGLIAEVEDFLSGRMAQRLAATTGKVPPWAVVNALAHLEPPALRELAGDTTGRHPSAPTTVVAELAGRVVEDRDDQEITSLQRSLLVPVELGVLNSRDGGQLSSAQIEALVVTVLAEWRTSPGTAGPD